MQYTKMLKLYLVCLSYLLIGTDVVRCEPDYLFKYEAKGWLKLHTTPATWEEALLSCYYEGAVLASPLNNLLASALSSLQQDFKGIRPIFLGTHDLFSKGDFISLEGVPLSDLKIKWNPYETGTGDCLVMSILVSTYSMGTSSCMDRLPFICYKKLDNQTINECGTFDNEYHLNQTTGSCYKVHHGERTWTRAYTICAREGGHLVILNDEEEARVVRDMFPVRAHKEFSHDMFHVGVIAWGDDRIWMTIHGDRIEDMYNNWDHSVTGTLSERYAALLDTGLLTEIDVDVRTMFVCEKSPDEIRYETPPAAIEE